MASPAVVCLNLRQSRSSSCPLSRSKNDKQPLRLSIPPPGSLAPVAAVDHNLIDRRTNSVQMVANGNNNITCSNPGSSSNSNSWSTSSSSSNSNTNTSIAGVGVNVLTRKKANNPIGGTDITVGGSSSSGAAARQLVQTLVDNGIISPGNKSTIRVVDTLNLGSSQVNLIRLVQPDVVVPVQHSANATRLHNTIVHNNNNNYIINNNNNSIHVNNNINVNSNDKTTGGLIHNPITTSSAAQQQNNICTTSCSTSSAAAKTTTTLLFGQQDLHHQTSQLLKSNGSGNSASVVIGDKGNSSSTGTSLVILASTSSSSASTSTCCESINDDMSILNNGGGGGGTIGGHQQVLISTSSCSSSTSSLTQNNNDGEPIKLPENLESLPKAEHFPTQRHRWNTNEEIAAILISFERHSDWQSKEVKIRPKSGSMLLYSRKKVRYRRDGYCWKKRKDGKTTREDHMKLKVQGTECIYGCYVHSAILPTFHRRCYWLLQEHAVVFFGNPDIVLVHYLNVPYPDDNKLAVITPSLALWGDKKEWTKEELVSQLKPMFYSEDEPDLNNELEISTAETVEAIVSQLMEKQRCARAAALTKQLECGCPDSTCADGKICSHPMRRITSAKPSAVNSSVVSVTHSSSSSQCKSDNILTMSSGGHHMITSDSSNQVSSTTGPGGILSHNNANNGGNTSSHHHGGGHHPHHRLMAVSMQETRATSLIHHQQSQQHQLHHGSSHHAQQHHPTAIINTTHQVSNCQTIGGVTSVNTSAAGAPLVLSLSQIQSSGGLLILNSAATSQHHDSQMTTSSSYVNSSRSHRNLLHRANTISGGDVKTSTLNILPKQEAMELEVISSCQVLSSSAHRLNDSTQTTTAMNKKQMNTSTLTGSLTDCRMISISNSSMLTDGSHNSSNSNGSSNNIVEKMDVTNSGGSNALSDMDSNSNNNSIIKIESQQPSPKRMNTASLPLNSSSSTASTASIAGIRDHHYHRTTHHQQIHRSNNDLSSSLMDVKPSFNNILDRSNDGKDVSDVHGSDSCTGSNNNSGGQYFNETLDLSQEDIQQTLSANMPMSCSTPEPQHSERTADGVVVCSKSQSSSDTDVLVLNPMDFIDVTVLSPPSTVDDDVFVNLDAFDMLGDFPELEVLESNHTIHNNDDNSGHCGGIASDNNNSDDITPNRSPLVDTDSDKGGHSHSDQTSPPLQYRQATANITDYSPEWAYPEGGVKVLVTGPWYSASSPYTVLFDSFPVPTTLVQSGVLRCYCPAHEVGLVTLQVACDGFVISNSAMFEYKTPPESHETTQQSSRDIDINDNDNLLKFTLLHRLEAMDGRLHIKQEPDAANNDVEDSCLFKQNNFEDRLVTYCQGLSQRVWLSESAAGTDSLLNEFTNGEMKFTTSWCKTNLKSMTLLHLAASLGYSRLVCTMLHWRAENTSFLLDIEVDALSRDDDGFTPLMWACANGHRDTALLLYQWNHTALMIRNNKLQSAVDCAVMASHSRLAEELKNLETTRLRNCNNVMSGVVQRNQLQPSQPVQMRLEFNNGSVSGSSDMQAINGLLNGCSNTSQRISSVNSKGRNSLRTEIKNEINQKINSNSNNNNRDDGIFLRPEAISINSNNISNSSNNKYKMVNIELHVNIPNNNNNNNNSSNNHSNKKYGCDIGNTVVKSSAEERCGNSSVNDVIDNRWNNSSLISNAQQEKIPNSPHNTCRDNDSISSNSNNNKLIKRQSIDSGIHLEMSPNNNSSCVIPSSTLTNALSTSSYSSSSSSLSSTASSSSNRNIINNNNNSNGLKNCINHVSANHGGTDHKLSRFDRSMSLPVSSPSTISSLSSSGIDSAYDSSSMSDSLFHSPVRKMDFALCDTLHHDFAVDGPHRNHGSDCLLLKQLELNDFTTDHITSNQLLLMSPESDNNHAGESGCQDYNVGNCDYRIDDSDINLEGGDNDDLMNASSNIHSDCISTADTGTSDSSSISVASSATLAGEQEVRVLTLAEQIIAAMPERIKNESEEMMLLLSNGQNSNGSFSAVEVMSTESVSSMLLDDVHIHNQNATTASTPSCFDTTNDTAFSFDHNYRYYDVATPSSSLSPASSSCLPSPSPSSFALPDSPSPPPTTADFCEFFHAGSSNSLFFEKDFSNLTLSDREQRELYEAAKIIQKAYRSYKGRKKLEEQDKERAAAVLIQNYYRRYKQYAYFKQMTKAAMVIQNGFRSYCEHKRFKKNQQAETETLAALRIQNYYRSYREQTGGGLLLPPSSDDNNNCSVGGGNGNIVPNGLKRTYSQRRQHQAARKIQQFMRQSKNNLWDIGHTGTLTAERTSRKREAGVPLSVTQGCPPKLALSHHITTLNRQK